jgi:hypothetical protein
MRLKGRHVETILRMLKFSQDMFVQKWDRLWPVRGHETDRCYDIPRVLKDW